MLKIDKKQRRKTSYKPLYCIILAIVMLNLMSVSLVSAWEIDNIKDYDPETRTATIKNSFLGIPLDTIAKVQLISDFNVNVIRGEDRQIAEFTIENFEEYDEGAFDDMEFLNRKKNMRPMAKNFNYKYKDIDEIIEVPDYETICNPYHDGNMTIENCTKIDLGTTHEEIIYVWKAFNKNTNLPAGNITLGIFIDVKAGEHGEWIPTLFGERIPEFASWTETLNVDIMLGYNFEQAGIINLIDNSSGSLLSGSEINTTGIIEVGRYYNGDTLTKSANTVGILGNADWSISLWFNATIVAGTARIFRLGNSTVTSGDDFGIGFRGGTNELSFNGFFVDEGAGTAGLVDADTWYHIVVNHFSNSTNIMYVNGVFNKSYQFTLNYDNGQSTQLSLGANPTGTEHYNGSIDEVYLWNRTLGGDEVIQLFNGGSGITYTTDFAPIVTLNSPTDNFNSSVSNVNFNCSVSDPAGIVNVSLLIDGAINETNTSGLDADYIFSKSLSDGTYIWNCLAFNNNDLNATGTNRTLDVDTTAPIIDAFLTPAIVTSINETVTINYTITEPHLDTCLYQYNNTNTSFDCVSGVNNVTNFTSVFPEIEVIIYVNDTLGNSNSSTLNFSYDADSPIIIINVPTGTLDFNKFGGNETLNTTITDIGLDTCLYQYNNTNTSFDCVSGITNTTEFVLTTQRNLTIYANDSFGNSNSSFTEWDYKVFVNNQTFNNQTTEGATETFSINFTKVSSLQVSTVDLIYNGTANSFPYSVTGNEVISESTIVIPAISSDVNVSFSWNITLSDDSLINTSSNNQSISTIDIDNCDSFTNLLYNFTQYDEENKSVLTNTTIDLQVNLYDSSKTLLLVNFSQKYFQENPAQVCLEDSLLTTVNYSSYVVAKYFANLTGAINKSYSIEYHNILNQTIGNTTIPKDIALYDLKVEDTTKFRLTFRDSSYVLAPNILVNVYRQYVEDNDFKIVEIPLTDSNGQTMLNLVKNDVVYNFIMIDENGDVIATFNSVTAFCQDFTIGECTMILAPDAAGDPVYDYDEEFGISLTSPSYNNETTLISINFITDDLTPKTVTLEVFRNNDFGNRSVCSNSLTAASGILGCNVSSITDSDQYLFTQVFVEDELASQDTINLNASTLNFGILNGAFYAFLMVLFLITMFMEDKRVLLISLALGWLVVISLGLMNGSLIGASSAGIWILVSIGIFIWKLNKEATT